MFERILVPLDGSHSGEVVLRFLRRLPFKPGTTVVLTRIVVPDSKDPGPGFVEESLQFAASYLREVAAGLEKGQVAVETVVRNGPVAETLISIAVEENASLIALATHGRTASAGLPYGGVAEQLLRASPVPILAVPSFSRVAFGDPSGEGKLPVRNLLVTTDGSGHGDSILPLAVQLAEEGGFSVVLLQLRPAKSPAYGALRRRSDVEDRLERLARVFRRKGIPTECATGRASPVRGILDVAERRQIDLIAMSTHGESKVRAAALGSVARSVLQQGGIPVLVTRVEPLPPRSRRSGAGHRSLRG
jgi:nucleotide-binding universal stress UspA family protein